MKTRITIDIVSNYEENTVDFIYNREDLEKPKDKDEAAFLIFVAQLIRGVLDNGFTAMKGKEDGKSVEEH